MLEVIKEYCDFHKCVLIINYKAHSGLWSVCLFDENKSSGHWHAENLAEAFNQSKNEYENPNKGE